MEKVTKFVKVGNKVLFQPVLDGLEYKLEANKVYNINVDRYTSEISLEVAPDFVMPNKLYTTNEDTKFMNKVLNRYKKSTNGFTGVMLSGLKGSGKTIMSKRIALESNLPIILIDKGFNPRLLKNFLNMINNINICIIFDEVDKIGEDYSDDYLLQILDGVNTTGRNLILFTANDSSGMNRYLMDRCSRIRYWKEFDEIDPSMIRTILKDKLDDKTEVDTLTDFIVNNFGCISFDNVCSFAVEVNENPKDTFEELFDDMNLSTK